VGAATNSITATTIGVIATIATSSHLLARVSVSLRSSVRTRRPNGMPACSPAVGAP